MSCKECSERRRLARDALLRSAVGESIAHVAKGAAEMTGLKKKTATAEARAKRKTGAAGSEANPADNAQE